ncbi:MAG: hypothetical protein V7K88_26690 [Nostoc sp.]|uniref:hypothetical protein n=1 Tax=Nostoc sp. TaxID=1180 RepID=UPI002FF55EF4
MRFQKSNINPSSSDKSNYLNMTFITGVCLIIPITLRMYKSSNARHIKGYMNRFKSILLGGLLAAASIAAFSQNANAAEFKFEHDHFNRNTVAFNNSKVQYRRQVREQHARELRERQAREQRAHEWRERQAHERHVRELRERQARFYH